MAVVDFKSSTISGLDNTTDSSSRRARRVSFSVLILAILGIALCAPQIAESFVQFLRT